MQLVFAAELSIKMIVFNTQEFFGSLLNRLDLAAVVISVIFNAAQNFFWDIDMVSDAAADMVQVCRLLRSAISACVAKAFLLLTVLFLSPPTRLVAGSRLLFTNCAICSAVDENWSGQ